MTICPHCKASTTFGRCVACKGWVDPTRLAPRTNTPPTPSVAQRIREAATRPS